MLLLRWGSGQETEATRPQQMVRAGGPVGSSSDCRGAAPT